MNHIFHLQLATDRLLSDAQQIKVQPQQLQAIQVKVHASITALPKPYLWLTYTIKLPSNADDTLVGQLKWSDWQPQQVSFTDYLWEHTCLECFISTDTASNYIEINASPDGRYAIYNFKEYREPAGLPPPPLYLADSQLASIDWATDTKGQLDAERKSHHKPKRYERRFAVALNPLLLALSDNNHQGHLQLHPCVILYVGSVALYFAPAHASPPDFHQRRYWTSITATAAH